MNIKTSAPTPQAFLWPASLHVMSFFDSSIIQSSLCCHYEYYNHRSCLFCYRPTIIAVIYTHNVWSQLFGAGVNYPGFISQKDLLRRERIYIHAITINLSGPGCIQSFLENLNYIEKLRMEGKVEKLPFGSAAAAEVCVCATLSVRSRFRHFVSASLSNLLIRLKARANLRWAEDGRVQQRGAERCWTSWRKQPRWSTYHVAVLVHVDFVVTVFSTERGL